jgi:hypothetical protein
MVNLETPGATTPGTPPVVLPEHFERVKPVHLAHQDLQRQLIGQMGALGHELIPGKGAISHSSASVTVVELADLVSGQSLSSFLGHICARGAPARSLRSVDH